MFLCKECLIEREEFGFLWRFEVGFIGCVSYGRCEDCNEAAATIDVHHSLLKLVSGDGE